MKNSLFVLFAALALVVAAPAVAQDTPEVEPYEERTNPDADSIAGDSGLTITGTVVEWNDEQLRIKTATGVHPIQIVPQTRWGQSLTVGDQVSVDYTRTTQGVMIASQIRTSGTVVGGATVTETTTSSLDTGADVDVDADADADWNAGELDTEVDVEAEADFDADADLDANLDTEVDANVDTDTTWNSSNELPATGSELPLAGLLGLLSLGAAVGLRNLR